MEDKILFDNLKSKMLKYIMYKKRTEKEIRMKFSDIEENLLDDLIAYLKEAEYISDEKYVERAINEFININTLSMFEIEYKLLSKGIDKKLIENYFLLHENELLLYEQQCAKKIFYKKQNVMTCEDIILFLKKKGYKQESIDLIKE